MKTLSFCGLFSACILMLSSCLEGGSNEQSQSGVCGIIRFDMKTMKTVIDAPGYPYSFYDPQIEYLGFSDNDCILFSYNVNYSDEINTNYQTTGIVQGSISNVSLIDQWRCISEVINDSVSLIENEQPIAYAVSTNGPSFYYSERLFLTSDFERNTEQRTSWYLYYEPELPTKEVEGKVVYSLFLRAVMTAQGKAPLVQGSVINVYNTGNFFGETTRIEKEKGKSEVNFQIHYINDIGEDRSSFTWVKSDVLSIPIPED
ncbi:MAG: hypothetical protein LBK65_02795 [Tannerellaceae bacterium]|jgi:hypothetical protein|nr:hypothetical protein [Tannerellaceae bacterium]